MKRTKLPIPETMKGLAEAINAHIKRFEMDPRINENTKEDRTGTSLYYCCHASYFKGPKISVTYISYQHQSMLSKAEATAYLAALDAGFIGRHHEALRDTEHDRMAKRRAARK